MSPDPLDKDDAPPSFDDTRILPPEGLDESPKAVPVASVETETAEPSLEGDDEQSPLQKYLPWGALAVAVIALIVAFVVGGREGDSVAPSKIEDGSITGTKIADDTIGVRNLDEKAKSATVGATGPTGPKGPAGKSAGSAASTIETVQASSANNSADLVKTVRVSCPAGTFLSGGGAQVKGGTDVFMSFSSPVLNSASKPVGWLATAEEITQANKAWSLTATALCLKGANAKPASTTKQTSQTPSDLNETSRKGSAK